MKLRYLIKDNADFNVLSVANLALSVSLYIWVTLLVIYQNLKKSAFWKVLSIEKSYDLSPARWKTDVLQNTHLF